MDDWTPNELTFVVGKLTTELENLRSLYAYYDRMTKEEILRDLELQMQAKEALIAAFQGRIKTPDTR